ncbi:hypothetical protein [Propionivibrio sp.]|uniref:hypothetical protein n=1 Tax=Propionivibrio sp. TaxID=2212460 RepID=UPI003BF44085
MADSSLAYAGVQKRLSMCMQIMSLRERLASAPAATELSARVLTGKRVQAIRRVLLDRPGKSLADELLSPKTGFTRLAEILNAAKGGDESERLVVQTYAEEIQKLLKSISYGETQAGMAGAIDEKVLRDALSDFPGIKVFEASNTLVDANIARGKFDAALRDEIAHAASLPNPEFLRIEDVAPELAKLQNEAAVKAGMLRLVYRDKNKEYELAAQKNRKFDGMDGDAYKAFIAAGEAQTEAYIEYRAKYDESTAMLSGGIKDALEKAKHEARAPITAVGQKVIDALVKASPITAESAKAWAEAQEITKSAAARLGKMGYPVKKLRADMAEFFQITGGRVTAVRVNSQGDRRANATDITTHGETGTINLDGQFNKKVLWHELAHHFESDPVARIASGRLIRRRAVDDKTYSLRSLTGNSGYKPDERAYKDSFFNEYVGKIYSDGMSEVFSMGVESFSDPLLLGQRMAKDPETLEFVSGYLLAEQSPLAKAFSDIRDSMREMNEGMVDIQADSVKELQAQIASMVSIDPTTDMTWLKGNSLYGMDSWTLTGRIGEAIYLFSGKVKSEKSRRKVNGLILVRDTGGWPDSIDLPTTDVTIAKVAAHIWSKRIRPWWHELSSTKYLMEHGK